MIKIFRMLSPFSRSCRLLGYVSLKEGNIVTLPEEFKIENKIVFTKGFCSTIAIFPSEDFFSNFLKELDKILSKDIEGREKVRHFLNDEAEIINVEQSTRKIRIPEKFLYYSQLSNGNIFAFYLSKNGILFIEPNEKY